ncbi:peptidoglycan DD-metalloendopeptidase family protein [Candidatus Peregrinibacteria bacterium]|nr:peptidoglycan DD-metalloendopeptidase family protein [Candidatus Peregrinibacteria bacterium]
MTRLLRAIIAGNVISVLVLWSSAPLWAEETSSKTDYSEDNLIDISDQGLFDSKGQPILQWQDTTPAAPVEPKKVAPDEDLKAYQEGILSQWGSQNAFDQERLRNAKEAIIKEHQNFNQLGQKIKEIEGALAPFSQQIKELKDQVALFNKNIETTQKQIEDAEQRIVKKQLDIKDLMKRIEISRVIIADQQRVVLGFIGLMYHEEEQYLDLYTNGTDTFKLLLADQSVGESLQGQEYARLVEQLGRDFFHQLELKHRDLNEKQQNLQKQQQELTMLYTSLDAQKQQLQEQRLAKQDLLDKTQGEESRYQELLEEAIQQQMESMIAIQNMKDSLGMIETKLTALDATPIQPSIDESQKNFEPSNFALPSSDLFPGLSSTPLEWPINPIRGISAYYHDSTYPKRWGIHNAIDIRTPQGTPIHAPANAYVFETKDNGMGYNYIILAHKDNLITVYGHVSELLVKPGMVIRKGDVIGLTGGLLGTKGAGLQTTGPHLHLEVYKNGQHTDPLEMLPFWQMPAKYIPPEYLKKLEK